jgi:Bacterial TSP3 repeat
VLFDRVTGSNVLLVTGTTGTGWSSWVLRPALSTNGMMLAFQSWDAGVVPGDLNLAGDAFASALDVLSTLDSDGDGIPDWWTTQYFGHATGQAGDQSRASDDADGDGLTNLEEYFAGTNPKSSSSVLVLHIATASNSTATLSWPAVPGRNYQVLTTAELSNPDWQVVPGSVGVVGGQGYFTVSAIESQRYFRILCTD